MLAIGVNLLWGYTGLLSLGQALFFSLGGYALGMHLMLMIGKLGQYKADIPDFMVFLEFAKRFPETGGLPPHWIPFKNFWFAALMVIVVPAVVSFVFGWLAFRSRIKGVYFSILSQALTYAATLMFFRNDFTFGGNNGLTDFKFILGHEINSAGTKRGLFIASVVLLLSVYLFCRWLTSTKFGLIQRAIRDSENRVLFSGYATANFKLFVFVLSGIICGLGRRAVRAAGRHHQSQRDGSRKIIGSRRVVRGGRTRQSARADSRRDRRQRAEKLCHAFVRRAMALHSRRAVHLRDAVHAQGIDRLAGTIA